MALAGLERGAGLSIRRPSAVLAASGAALALCLLLGGGTRPGFLADAALQLMCVPLLLLIIHRWRSYDADIPGAGHARLGIAVMLGLVLLHLLQVVPLPPEVWSRLPAREPVAKAFELSGQQLGWMPISVAPSLTWLALLSLVPSIVVFLGTVQLGLKGRRVLVVGVVAFSAFSAMLGMLQVAQGPASILRLFPVTNETEAVGLFANRNHFAALLYCSLLLVVPWLVASSDELSTTWKDKVVNTRAAMLALAGFTVIIMLIAGQMMARSRAGLGLMLLAMLASVVIAMVGRRKIGEGGSPRLVLAALLVGVVFAGQFALYRALERFDIDPLSDSRLPFTTNTLEAARAYLPFGSGVGTFLPVYAMYEKLENVVPRYANRAHNDMAEALLETGIPGVALFIAFVLWIVLRSARLWSAQPFIGASRMDVMLARAASICVLLLLAHSVVDYPLRTAGIGALFALCCGLMLPPPRSEATGVMETERSTARRRSSSRRTRSSTREPAVAAPTTPFTPPLTSTFSPPITDPSVRPAIQPAPHREVPQVERNVPLAQPPEAAGEKRGARWGDGVSWPEQWKAGPAGNAQHAQSPPQPVPPARPKDPGNTGQGGSDPA